MIDRTIFDALSEKQLEVLGSIAINLDFGHHPRTLASLVARDLIVEYEDTLPGRWPVIIKRYAMEIPVHIAWCQWCSDNFDDEGNRLPREGGAE